MVGIHHELEVRTDGLPGSLNPPEVLANRQEAHLHLDSSEPGLLERAGLLATCSHTLVNVNSARVIVIVSGDDFYESIFQFQSAIRKF